MLSSTLNSEETSIVGGIAETNEKENTIKNKNKKDFDFILIDTIKYRYKKLFIFWRGKDYFNNISKLWELLSRILNSPHKFIYSQDLSQSWNNIGCQKSWILKI